MKQETKTKKSNGGFYFLAILLKILTILGAAVGVAMIVLHIIELFSVIEFAKYVTLVATVIMVIEGILLFVISCMSMRSHTLKSPVVANIILAICMIGFSIGVVVLRLTCAGDKWPAGLWILSLVLMAMSVGPQGYILKSFYWR